MKPWITINMHVEITGDNPNEKKQTLFIQNSISQRKQSASLVFGRDSKENRRAGRVESGIMGRFQVFSDWRLLASKAGDGRPLQLICGPYLAFSGWS